MNAWTWGALIFAIFLLSNLFAVAICRAGAEADRRTEEWVERER